MAISIDVSLLSNISSTASKDSAAIQDLAGRLESLAKGFSEGSVTSEQLASGLEYVVRNAEQVGNSAASNFNRANVAIDQTARSAQELNQVLASSQDDRPMALVGEDLEQVGENGEKAGIGAKLAESSITNLGFSAMSAGQAMSGPGGLLESLGSFLGFMGFGLGGTGVGLGIGAASAVTGIALSALGAKMSETGGDTDDLTKSVANLLKEFNEANPASDALGKSIQSWAEDASSYGLNLTDLARYTSFLGQNLTDVASVMAGPSLSAMKQLDEELNKYKGSQKDLAEQIETGNGVVSAQSIIMATQEHVSDAVRTALEKEIKAREDAANAEKAEAAAMGLTVSQYERYQAAVTAADQAQSDLTSTVQGWQQSLDGITDKENDVAKAQDQVTKAQATYDKAVAAHGATSAAAKSDLADLKGAQDAYNESVAQGGFDLDSYMTNLQQAVTQMSTWPAEIQAIAKQGASTAALEYIEQNQDTAQKAWDAAKGNASQQQALISAWNQAGALSGAAYQSQLETATNLANSYAQKNPPVISPIVDSAGIDAALASRSNVTQLNISVNADPIDKALASRTNEKLVVDLSPDTKAIDAALASRANENVNVILTPESKELDAAIKSRADSETKVLFTPDSTALDAAIAARSHLKITAEMTPDAQKLDAAIAHRNGTPLLIGLSPNAKELDAAIASRNNSTIKVKVKYIPDTSSLPNWGVGKPMF